MAGVGARAAIALGSNLGDRVAALEFAIGQLSSLLDRARVSRFLETEPVGVGPQPRFLNAAMIGDTTLSPARLLDELLRIELAGGRQRPHPGAARTLDLDLILCGDAVVDTVTLTLPHPRFRERLFVLEPLVEIAPAMVDPVTGKTIAALWSELRER